MGEGGGWKRKVTLFAPDKGFIDKTALARGWNRVFNYNLYIYIYVPPRWIYFYNDNLIQRQCSL